MQEPVFVLENRHRCDEPTLRHQSEFRPEPIVSDAGDEVDHHFSAARLMRIWRRDSLEPRVVCGRHKSTRSGQLPLSSAAIRYQSAGSWSSASTDYFGG